MGNTIIPIGQWAAAPNGKLYGATKSGNPDLTGTLIVTGTGQVGQTLAYTDTTESVAVLGAKTYQWKRDGVDISGETGTTYLLDIADLETSVSVEMSATDGWGNAKTSEDATASLIISAGAIDYYVETTGNDTTGNGLSVGTAFATWDKAASVVVAGDTVHGGDGTYLETGSTNGTVYFAKENIGILADTTGTPSNRITYQASAVATPGAVIIDLAFSYTGFVLWQAEYITIQGLVVQNASIFCVSSRGLSNDRVSTAANSIEGCIIQNNHFEYTRWTEDGSNIGAIRADQCKDWTIKGNKIRKVWSDTSGDLVWLRAGHVSGIQCYDAWNLLIENNEISDTGSAILIKDHSLTTDDALLVNRVYHTGTEARYNEIFNCEEAFGLITNESGGDEASNNNFHHNLCYEIWNIGVRVNMSNSLYNSQVLDINYNIFREHPSATGTNYGVNIDSTQVVSMKGNMFVDFDSAWTTKVETALIAGIDYSDYNVFVQSTFGVSLDVLGANVKTFTTLASIRDELISDATQTLNVDNPETNSIESTSAVLFTTPASNVYTHKAGSPAIGMMDDGNDAGCYNLGAETIGPTEAWVIAA